MPKKSQVIELLDLVWQNANKATSFSYERLNHAMRNTLQLAIGSGFEFWEDDVELILDSYRSGYWIGESNEWIYSSAIANGNMSAIKSFEKFKKRDPFIADNVSPARHGNGNYLHGDPSTRKRERLAVGSEFQYRGLKLKVNSFADDSSYINCGYYEREEREDRYGSDKLKKRFKITVADIQAERKERKERDKMLMFFKELVRNDEYRDEVPKRLGIKRESEYATLPIEKIRKVYETFVAENNTRKGGA